MAKIRISSVNYVYGKLTLLASKMDFPLCWEAKVVAKANWQAHTNKVSDNQSPMDIPIRSALVVVAANTNFQAALTEKSIPIPLMASFLISSMPYTKHPSRTSVKKFPYPFDGDLVSVAHCIFSYLRNAISK